MRANSEVIKDMHGRQVWLHFRNDEKFLGWTKLGSGISGTSCLHYDAEGLAKGESTSLDAWVKILAPGISLDSSPPPLHKSLVEPKIRNPARLPAIGLLLLVAVGCFIAFPGKFPFGNEANVQDTLMHQTSAPALEEVQAPPVPSLPEQIPPTPRRQPPSPPPPSAATQPMNASTTMIAPTAPIEPYPADSNEPTATNLPMRGERFPQTRLHIMTRDELAAFDREEVRYAINELYARRGGVFSDKDLNTVFSAKPWYKPREDLKVDEIVNEFTSTEKANMLALAKRRAELGAASVPTAKPEEIKSPQRPMPKREPGIDLDRY